MALLDKQGLAKLIDGINKNINTKMNFIKNSTNEKIDKFYNRVVRISTPIIKLDSTYYDIGVTKDGELTCARATKYIEDEVVEIILESANGTLFKVVPTSECELTTTVIEKSDNMDIKDVYLQASKPYGIIFKVGVLDDGTLITSTISDIRLIDDTILSKEMSWSSAKINEELSKMEVGGGGDASKVLMSDGKSVEKSILDLKDLVGQANQTLIEECNKLLEV